METIMETEPYYEAEIEISLFKTNDIVITSDQWTPPFGPDDSRGLELIDPN